MEKPQVFESGPNPNALDKAWYGRFEKINSKTEVTDVLTGKDEVRKAEKQAFLEGNKHNPDLDYPKLDPEELLSQENDLLALKADIIKNESNEAIRQAYRWRINERIATLRMLRATADGDMHRFGRYSDFIYGKPDMEIFMASVNRTRDRFEELIKSEDPQIAKATKELFEELPARYDVDKPYLPDEKTIEAVKDFSKKQIAELELRISKDHGEYTAVEITKVFQDVLNKIKANNWEARVVYDSGTGINTNQSAEKIDVPSTREVKSLKLKQLILHELRTHVERRVHGENSRLSLLGLGLDRYEGAEEGIATQKEQGLSKELTDYAGFQAHLAVCLARGLDGKPRDFREVFEVMARYFYVMHRANGKDHDFALKRAGEGAWSRCVRTFRGTDCKTPGACLTKEIIYREGNIAAWDLVGQDPNSLLKFSIGKYDPSNPNHLWILSQLEITDEALDKLDEEKKTT